MAFPPFQPIPLDRARAPFSHPDWLFAGSAACRREIDHGKWCCRSNFSGDLLRRSPPPGRRRKGMLAVRPIISRASAVIPQACDQAEDACEKRTHHECVHLSVCTYKSDHDQDDISPIHPDSDDFQCHPVGNPCKNNNCGN